MNKLIPVTLGITLATSSLYYLGSKKLFDIMFKAHQKAVGGPDLFTDEYNEFVGPAVTWYKQQTTNPIEVTSYDGYTLQGETFVHPDCKKWMILAHAYRSNRELMIPHAKYFYEAGFNVLIFDQRGHGSSQGKYISMGWHEQFDLISWITYVIEQDAQASIGLLGISMGAATTMYASGNDLPNNVKCMIHDSGCSGIGDIFLEHMEKNVGIASQKLLLGFQLICKKKLGIDIFQTKPQEQLSKSVTPSLFIHGQEDTFVSIDNVYLYYEACSSEKELFIVPERDHAFALLDEHYFPTIQTFLDKYM